MNDAYTHGPPKKAMPLLEAIRCYLPASLWEEYFRLTDEQNPPPKRRNFLPAYVGINQHALRAQTLRARRRQLCNALDRAMRAKLEAGELVGIAQHDPPFGPWRVIPAVSWRQMRLRSLEKGEYRSGAHVLSDIRVLQPESDDQTPTGMPGRQAKGAATVRAEFERRAAAGETKPTLGGEARALADWYRETYPRRTCPTPKTIENNLREAWRRVRAKPE